MATSVASRPRAINTRPMRGTLLRASKVCQCPSRKTSNHAAKSGGAVRRRHADVAQVTGAVAGRYVHAPAEGDGEMRVVAAHPGLVVKRFERRPRHPRMLVAERDVAGGRNRRLPGRGPLPAASPEKLPRRLRQAVGLAIPASQQEQQRLLGQILHGMLPRLRSDRVRRSGVVHDRIGRNAHAPLRGHDPRAPVAEAVAISGHRDRRVEQPDRRGRRDRTRA